MKCSECGADLEYFGNECTPNKCSNHVNVKKDICKCDLCICNIMCMNEVCSKCTKGYHRSELKA